MFYSMTLKGYFSSKKLNLYSSNHLENLSLFIEEDVIELGFKILINYQEKFFLRQKNYFLTQTYVGFSITQGNEYRKKKLVDL